MAENNALSVPRRAVISRDGLVVVLVFASMIVSGLSMVQGHTIESQRNMIRTLFLDSKELSAMKMRDLEQKHVAAATRAPEKQLDNSAKDGCAAGKSCAKSEATPSKAAPEKSPVPENSDEALPNPQRLLHSI